MNVRRRTRREEGRDACLPAVLFDDDDDGDLASLALYVIFGPGLVRFELLTVQTFKAEDPSDVPQRWNARYRAVVGGVCPRALGLRLCCERCNGVGETRGREQKKKQKKKKKRERSRNGRSSWLSMLSGSGAPGLRLYIYRTLT